MATIADLITDSLRRISAIAADETPSSGDMEVGFNVLNSLCDALTTQRLTLPWVRRRTFTITGGTGSYTIGNGAVWDTTPEPRPNFIKQINYQDTSQSPTLEYQLSAPLTPDLWAAIPQKDLTSYLPTDAYYEPWSSAGLGYGTVYFYPIPTATTLEAVLYIPTAVAAFTNRYADLIVPQGFQRFLTLSLAYELCPIMSKTASQDLKDQLSVATRDIKRVIAAQIVPDMNFDGILLRSGSLGSIATFKAGG
jgi:hypothetical protein